MKSTAPGVLSSVLALVCGSSIAQSNVEAKPYHLGLPGKAWSVSLPLEGYRIHEEQLDDPMAVSVLASNPSTGMVLSAFIEDFQLNDSVEKVDAGYCNMYYEVQLYQSPLAAFQEAAPEFKVSRPMDFSAYFIPSVDGKEVRQEQTHGYFAVGRACVDVHLSKTNYTSADQGTFVSTFDGVKVLRQAP